MAITLWKNRTPFGGMVRWLDDDFFTADFGRTFLPAIDVEEKNGAYQVKADLPGMKKDDIHIELQDHMLILRGERRDEHEEKEGRYRRVERTYGSFERSFRLPESVTKKDIQAKYTNGVLELTIPAPKAEAPRAIDITVD